MKTLAAINSFKGTITSYLANEACIKACKKILPKSEFTSVPVSDGGDGFLDCFSKEGDLISLKVNGPLPEMTVDAKYILKGKEAFIEIAQACGIKYLKKSQLKPMEATSYGVGELIEDAIKRGARIIYLGLGGTASSDGGVGMARALGFSFLNEKGNEIKESIFDLLSLNKIKAPKEKIFKSASFMAISDVKNPLLGKDGTAKTYSPQKGASTNEVETIEKALTRLSQVIKKDLRTDVTGIRGAGSAGGLGAGLAAFCRAEIVDGAIFISERKDLFGEIFSSDLVFTGEAIVDQTTLNGKMPLHIAYLSRLNRKKSFCICYENKIKDKAIFDFIIEMKKYFSLSYCMSNPALAIEKTIIRCKDEIIKKALKNSKI